MVSANSISDLKATPLQLAIVEEPDDSQANIKNQGASIDLFLERMKRQPSGQMIFGGTPSVKGISKVEKAVGESDIAVLPIKCHNCNKRHVLIHRNYLFKARVYGGCRAFGF